MMSPTRTQHYAQDPFPSTQTNMPLPGQAPYMHTQGMNRPLPIQNNLVLNQGQSVASLRNQQAYEGVGVGASNSALAAHEMNAPRGFGVQQRADFSGSKRRDVFEQQSGAAEQSTFAMVGL